MARKYHRALVRAEKCDPWRTRGAWRRYPDVIWRICGRRCQQRNFARSAEVAANA